MAGHSQFKNIMHRKGAQDAKRSRLFSKLAREVTVAAKMGLPEPDKNARLRAAIAAARAENMPKDNIDRAIKKAQGSESDTYEDVRYEGYGIGGVALIVEALTDNRNRTSSDVRSIFSKFGGNLGATGVVSHMFNRVGQLIYKPAVASVDDMLEAAIEAGAEDCLSTEDGHEVVTTVEDFAQVRDALQMRFGDADQTKLVWKPNLTSPVGEAEAQTLLKMIDALDDNDDVQNVFANFEISDDLLAKLSA